MNRTMHIWMFQSVQNMPSYCVNDINNQPTLFRRYLANCSRAFRCNCCNKQCVLVEVFVHHILMVRDLCLSMHHLPKKPTKICVAIVPNNTFLFLQDSLIGKPQFQRFNRKTKNLVFRLDSQITSSGLRVAVVIIFSESLGKTTVHIF